MIAIYNLEPKYFNLALEKVRKFYEDRGELVDDYKPLWHNKYDKIYCSSIFTWTDKSTVTDDMMCGGTGFDLTTNLPSEIEAIKVKKNRGFTTRGCIRNCDFCVVPQKEGKLRRTNHISDFWDGKAKTVELFDNNWLADQQWFWENTSFLLANELSVIENGMDIRLVNEDIAFRLMHLDFKKQIHFAWDQMKDEKTIENKITLLREFKLDCMFYVLVNYNTTIEEDLYRRNKINEWGYDAFIMIYDKPNAPQIIKHLARWNNRFMLRSQSFEDYLKEHK